MKRTYFFIIIYFFIFSCSNSIHPPEVKEITSLYGVEINKDNIALKVNLKVHNSNKQELTISNFSTDVYINDKLLSTISSNDELILVSGDNNVGPIQITIPYNKIKNLLPILYKETEFTFKGNIKIKKYGLNIPYKLNHKIKLDLKDLIYEYIN